MKKILVALLMVFTTAVSANAYQVLSSKELGQRDAKNQNVVVKCTTDTGKVSNQTCSLRRWLNGEFLSSAFSEQEQELIKTTTIKATAYSSDNSGKDTEDRVFLLSTDEAYSFISAYTEENWRGVWWWLRTKGAYYDSAAYVREDGSIASMGRSADDSGAVRPVIIIKLE